MRKPSFKLKMGTMVLCVLTVSFGVVIPAFCLADDTAGPWQWSGTDSEKSVTILLLGDFNVQKREHPDSALVHVRETLNAADLVYANLEGLLVASHGPDKDIPGKGGWQHLGTEAVEALKAGNIGGVGVANNVAYGRANIMKSLSVLDANGIAHAGAGENLNESHQPAIIERKGLKVGFLQYTAKWYEEKEQIATDDLPGVARLLSKDGLAVESSDMNRLLEDIRRLRPLVDVVMISHHTRDGQNRTAKPSGTKPARTVPPPDQDLYSLLPVNRALNHIEPYQKLVARAAIDAGADVVFGHGCHMLQAVELYRDRPIMHCLGNFASDWIRVRNYKDGLVARVVVEGKKVKRVSLVPVTRDDDANNVLMLDPSAGKGASLYQELKDLSPGISLEIDGQEIVLIDNP